MKTFIKMNTWLTLMDCGWGNGYVIIPSGHKLHGKHYDMINGEVSVHGGLTFSEPANELDWDEIGADDKDGWIVGFDTVHYGDNSIDWPEERVIEETEELCKQLEKL